MPLKYSAPYTLRPPVEGVTVQLVGVMFDLPTDAEVAAGAVPSVTWKFKALNAKGEMVGEREYMEPLSQIQAEDAPNFIKAHAIIKAHGYGHAVNAGFPAGGSIV